MKVVAGKPLSSPNPHTPQSSQADHTQRETFASLVRVCIRGGSTHLAEHLAGIIMEVTKANGLIALLRKSGYPGYEDAGINSIARVNHRMKEQYISKYGVARFFLKLSSTCSMHERPLAHPSFMIRLLHPLSLGSRWRIGKCWHARTC